MRKLFFLVTLLLAAMQLTAANVDLVMAKMTALRFMQSQVAAPRFNGVQANNVRLLHAEVNSTRADQAVYYIFNSDRGFIIVAGDDRAQQILAYGDRPLDMKRMPENMKFWLSTYKAQIEYLQAHPGLVVNQPMLNTRLTAPTIAPLLTAEWDQDIPYYNHCPAYNGSLCLTGCPATSLSMVFYYWKYPTDPTPPVEGYTNETYGFEVEALPSITFDWANMLDKYRDVDYTAAQADAVAWLMRYVGQEEHMNYSTGGSGAYSEDILRAVKFFGYDEETAQVVFKTRADDNGNDIEVYYTDEEWATLLQDELAEGRPMVYCAYDYDTWYGWSGHAFNVDGYTAGTNTYHVNWGWSGDGNGDFALNAFTNSGLTFNVEQQVVMGIQPPAQGPSIKVNPSRLNLESFVDQDATATFTVKGQDLTSAITLTLNDESGYFSMDASSVAVAEQSGGKVITVTYAPRASGNHTATITLSSPGAKDKIININGVATLNAFNPVMLPADEAYINLTQFRADWTDETAAKYVDNYTLEVSAKPAVQLLDSIDGSNYPGGYVMVTLTEPWGGEGVRLGNNAIYFNNYDYEGCITYTVPDGYDNDVFSVQITTVANSYGSGNLIVGSQQTAGVEHYFNTNETYTWLVTASEGEKISITSNESYYSPDMSMIRIYAGDVNELNTLHAVAEQGNANYRLITGITDQHYLVKNLAEGGTFFYKVKANYIDGTQSAWSKAKVVTLIDNGHAYQRGDVDHDGKVDISDVTALIDYLLSGNNDICSVCADMDGSGTVDIADVTDLIDLLLGGN